MADALLAQVQELFEGQIVRPFPALILTNTAATAEHPS